MKKTIKENKIHFWKDGDYEAEGGFFIRNNLKDFIGKIIESGREPVGIKIDLDSFNLEVICKKK